MCKKCTRCRQEKPLDAFYKNGPSKGGISSECRQCKRERMGPINAAYYEKNREAMLLRVYLKNDAKAGRETDLTPAWMRENITSRPCWYCGTTEAPRGCDRIDNAIGHVIRNVVPCCKLCNKTRNDHFTHEEMQILGKTIALIRKARTQET